MARRRMISSSIYEDDWYGPLSFFEKELWVGLFVRGADDQGRLQDNPILIRSQIFMYNDVQIQEIEDALTKFSEDGKIIRYDVEGKKLTHLDRDWET